MQKFYFIIMAFLLVSFLNIQAQGYDSIVIQTVGPEIVIDGEFTEWDSATVHEIDSISSGGALLPGMNDKDFDPAFCAAWDSTYLYMFFRMTDQTIVAGDSLDSWSRDGVEIAFDGNADRDFNMFWQPQNSDMKIVVTYDATYNDVAYDANFGLNTGVHNFTDFAFEADSIDGGWGFEMKIPWRTLDGTLTTVPEKLIVAMAANDNDSTGRESIYRWSGFSNINNDPATFGVFTFGTDTIPEPAPPVVQGLSSTSTNFANVYPIPASNQINVQSDIRIEVVTITSLLGQQIYSNNAINDFQHIIDVSDLSKGTNIITIQLENGIKESKTIVIE